MILDLLFDTHSFIWWADEPMKLSRAALAALEDEDNRLFVNDVSIWEMQIKVQLGKIKLKLPLEDLLESQQQDNDVKISSMFGKEIDSRLSLAHLAQW